MNTPTHKTKRLLFARTLAGQTLRLCLLLSQRHLLQPISALTHLVGALASLAGLLLLAVLTWGQPAKLLSLIIYGVSMVALYTASALFHGARLPAGRRMWLNRLDHVAIFLLIAGTYTPIVYHFYPPVWRGLTLVIVWLVAAGGMFYKLFSTRIHGFLHRSIYPIVGWAGAVPAVLAHAVRPLLPPGGLALLALGGLIYTVGFVIYYRQRPDPWPDVFGHHEIWHLFVLAGSLCHFLFMLLYVVPF
ncbi:MAG: hemolysin III family protein [Chloroflexi bacterium]|nr:hemolysin III family protein [Chloroflexota bacterium]